jgi:hypothetical protein
MRRTWLIGVAAVGLFAGVLADVVWAAAGYDLTCLNKNCGYTGNCQLGPIRICDSIDGYCAACGKWVNLRWRRAGEQPPAPLGKVWVAETGKTVPVYACPNCKGPFLPVTQADMLKESKYAPKGTLGERDSLMRCPKCGEPSLKMKMTIAVD